MPLNTRVGRCVTKLRNKYGYGKAIGICQHSTKQNYLTGKKTRRKKRRKTRRKKRKRRKKKKKTKRRRGGDIASCAYFVPGGMDTVYDKFGGIYTGYINSDNECEKKLGKNYKCNSAKIAADLEEFQRRNQATKGRLYFTDEPRHKNLDSSCKLGDCCKINQD